MTMIALEAPAPRRWNATTVLSYFRTVAVFARICITPWRLFNLCYAGFYLWVFVTIRYRETTGLLFNFALVPEGAANLVPYWWANILTAAALGGWIAKPIRIRISTPAAWLLPGLRLRTTGLIAISAVGFAFITIARLQYVDSMTAISFAAIFLLVFATSVSITLRSPTQHVIAIGMLLLLSAVIAPDSSLTIAQLAPLPFLLVCLALTLVVLRSEFDPARWQPRTENALASRETSDQSTGALETTADESAEERQESERISAGLAHVAAQLRSQDSIDGQQRAVGRVRAAIAMAQLGADGSPYEWRILRGWIIACLVVLIALRFIGHGMEFFPLLCMGPIIIGLFFPLEPIRLTQLPRSTRLALVFASSTLRTVGLYAIAVIMILLVRWVVPTSRTIWGSDEPSLFLTVALLIGLTPLNHIVMGRVRCPELSFLRKNAYTPSEFRLLLLIGVMMGAFELVMRLPTVFEPDKMWAAAGVVLALNVVTYTGFYLLLRRRYLSTDLVTA